jgi:hypothetical protein
MLKLMRLPGLCATALALQITAFAAAPVDCAQGARSFLPCEVSFDWKAGDLPQGVDPYRSETIRVEFRSPNHKTYLMRAFGDGAHTLRVRFSPTEPGQWAYRVTGPIARYNDQEGSFNVADSGLPGFFAVANVRHWWTTNKQPHLWLSASAPFLSVEPGAFEQWLDARKHDGFTHVRGKLLSNAGPLRPLTADGTPNPQYFEALDERILAAANRGFGIDLVLADKSFVDSGAFSDYDQREALVRYVVARYGALDVSWQGVEQFDELADGRTLVRNLGEVLKKYDMFNHPRSTDARASSSPALRDGWMDFLMEASPRPELGAVEHQFSEQPQVHIVSAIDPDGFRHEIWNATTNGEYLSIPYEALQNAANVKAIHVWAHVMSETRHWELEPYFDVDGARAVGLNEVEYLAYAQTPGIVEVTLPKHKYNPVWVNPITGEETELKDYKGLVFSQQTPDSSHDWVLQVPREGHKAMMLRSYRFESEAPPIQEPELDVAKMPFDIADPPGEAIHAVAPPPYAIKLVRSNRATRTMEYVWWGEIVASSEGAHLLGIGPSGTFRMPPSFLQPGASLNIRLLAINANGKAYELDRVYELTP